MVDTSIPQGVEKCPEDKIKDWFDHMSRDRRDSKKQEVLFLNR